jgi:hypothetical protein
MKKVYLMLIAVISALGISGCAGMMDMAASMQKGRYIVDGKMIDPPYSNPMQNVSNGKIWVNGIYLTKKMEPGSAKLNCEEYQRQMNMGNLMIIGGEKSDEYRFLKDGEKKFNDVKAIIASKKPKAQKIKEIDAILEGTVDAKLVLDRNTVK